MNLFGMEIPDKWKVPLLVGGGGVILLIVLRGNKGSAPAVASMAEGTNTEAMGLGGSLGGYAQQEADQTEFEARRLQLREQEKEGIYNEAMRALGLREAETRLSVYQAQAELESTLARRRADVIRSKPVSCPHGYEERLLPDGTPYCRSKSGATNIRNSIVKPVDEWAREAIGDYLSYQTGMGLQ